MEIQNILQAFAMENWQSKTFAVLIFDTKPVKNPQKSIKKAPAFDSFRLDGAAGKARAFSLYQCNTVSI